MYNKLNKQFTQDQLSECGFTYAEVEELGLSALNELQVTFGFNMLTSTLGEIKSFYNSVINNSEKYRDFAIWLKVRFDKFVELNIPMRIYVGGIKQFISRGDEQLENSLNNVSKILEDYIETGYITSRRISNIFYYVNLIFK